MSWSRSRHLVFLDPDGSQDLGHYVLVRAPTGVTYELQCGGLLCAVRSDEGFLVPVGPARDAAVMREWVMCRFQDYGQRPASEWSGPHKAELRALVGRLRVWSRGAGDEDRSTPLAIDEARLHDCMEAWIPVSTLYGAGWFVCENSD